MSISLLSFELTDTHRDWLIDRPLTILSYIVVAVLLRYVLHKVIDRMTKPRPTVDEDTSTKRSILRPLQERAARNGVGIGDPAVRERRIQRAQTIGSVFKSGVSIVVLAWVVLQTLATLGSTSHRSSRRPASRVSRSVSARRTSSGISSPACSCCSRTNTA